MRTSGNKILITGGALAISLGLNTDLGRKRFYDHKKQVSWFIEAVFAKLKEGKIEITFRSTEAMTKTGPEELLKTFARMNQLL
jgi:hypothetical protein